MNREDDRRLIELCRRLADHALHIMTIHHDFVLHLAITFKRRDPVLKLTDELPPHLLDKITRQNILGNIVLYEIAVAEKLLNKAPGLLGMRNNNGQTTLFRAALYGKAEIFKFLDGKLSGYDPDNKQPFVERNDKSTILHVSVIARQFDLALQIANDYKNLIEQKDMDGMTALQLLSCKPEAFSCQSECDFFDKLINSSGSDENLYIDSIENPQFSTQLSNSDNISIFTNTEESHLSTPIESNSKRSRGGNFTAKEDLLIVSAWLNTSLDVVQGNEQKHKTYWARLLEYFHKYKNFESECTQVSLMNRWSTIQLATNKFCGCYA
ncbi:uncharacterized protein LOC116143615 [Pistacia vera]|uniref:uncharacterized protein LOC116143615 n=1 Tax=Pistacia vera TaxID=55513 RepID=UPI0012638205|nr:uncharacterized protein LOC116143615 [Pistacia vera]